MDSTTYVGLSLYIETFCARTDAYVKDSAVHIPEPLTPSVMYDVTVSKHAVSGYTARHTEDGRILTHVGAIDFDKTPDGAPALVQRTLTKLGIPSLLSLSRRGAHLWVVCEPGDGTHGSDQYGDVPASAVRRMLEQAVRLTDPKLLELVPDPKPDRPDNMAAQLEIFPKSSASDWGCGALRLPLMSHPKTKTRYPVFDMYGNRLTKMVDVITHLEYAPWPKVYDLGKDTPVEYPRGLGNYRKNNGEVIGPDAVALLASLGVDNAVPGRNVKCPFHGDSHASMRVAPDNQRVWCKAPECIAYNDGRGLGTIALSKMVQR